MENHEFGNVETASALRKQPVIHVFVFAAEQTRARSAELGRIASSQLERATTDDGIASHQHALITLVHHLLLRSWIDPPDNAQDTGCPTIQGGALPRAASTCHR